MNMLACEVLSAGYSHHTKPFYIQSTRGLRNYLIRFQVEGCCRALVDGEVKLIVPGDLLLYKPKDQYDLRVEAELQQNGELEVSSGDYYFFCRGSWLEEWWERTAKRQKLKLPINEDVLHLCRQTILEQRRAKAPAKEMAEYYLRLFCLTIERASHEQQTASGKGKSFLAYEMKRYIEEHALSPLKIEDVAAYVDLSVSRAVHLFKSVFNQTIMQYVQQIRLSVARERILFSKMSLEQIAEMSGFNSYTYFFRVFRARYGLSPKEYREGETNLID
ncbi:helix-turn-helix domain-containing protein [Paenibacillus mesophilus]|uniref:AraC family transcriptional regulator n=1 Tax=Paenibacillus mesophilus TaxID=2582849 RepID=UPI00110DD171|nr:AraC family transcriptional regulator [Paenibacillus mesophilus]TMV49475.1 helix-turn-helix domain-containing protein [Paenibacillus mesophilus]